MLGSPTTASQEAALYRRLDNLRVSCDLCAHRCAIDDGNWGQCGVRQNIGGTLFTSVYGMTIAENVDVVEKKPFYHCYPGTTVYSIAAPGCNFRCGFCTNWQVSQVTPTTSLEPRRASTPEQIVASALEAGCAGIAFTYTEPTIFFEYVRDIAGLARASGLYNVIKTNGFMTPEVLDAYHPHVHALNVDLKAFRDSTYRQFGGRLNPVLDTLKRTKALGIWLEITTVIIPGLTDDSRELRELTQFMVDELGPCVPWHVARFYPDYRMLDRPPTSVESLCAARAIGLEAGLKYVYLNNSRGAELQNTSCARCGHQLIQRQGGRMLCNTLKQGKCPQCNSPLSGIGLDRVG